MRAEETESTLNDVAVQILAQAFRVPYEPSGRRSTAPAAADRPGLGLRMPRKLDRAIENEATRRDVRKRDLIVKTLAEALGTPFVRAPRAAAR